jgi:Fe-S-cluster containining protein
MDKLGSFVNIKTQNFYFNNCNSCQGNCCNGANGFAISPLILEDFEDVYKNFKIVFALNENQIGAYVVLNDGKSYCKYYKNNSCSIYEYRTPACKLYPLSPYFEHILIDTQCPSVNQEFGENICFNSKLNNKFYTKRLDNFNEKLFKSYEFYNSINNPENFKQIGDILGLPIYKYTKNTSNKYIKLHLQSLELND